MKKLIKDIIIDMLISVKSYFFISCIVTLIIFAIWFLFYSAFCRRKNIRVFSMKKFKKMIFSFTLIGCYLMLFFETIYSRSPYSRDSLALIFYFEDIINDIYSGKYAYENVFLFIPFGFLWGGVVKKKKSVLKVSFISFLTSLTIEVTQLMTGRGYFQISDLITNTFGGFIGVVAYCLVSYVFCLYINYDEG
jgi:glycopeptide antibiotics resistance protein